MGESVSLAKGDLIPAVRMPRARRQTAHRWELTETNEDGHWSACPSDDQERAAGF